VSAEAARAIRLAARLAPDQREALILRYVDGMPPRDIAPIVGESENAVSVRIHRGLQKLREMMNVSSHE
jgi:RNA polymerase sigma-70 factor (ECF subfamily)